MKLKENPKELTDIELLEQLSTYGSDSCYNEFVKRYYDDVKKECLLICSKRKLDKHIGEQIAHETFEKIKRTKSFDREKLSKKCDRKAILGWLYRIFRNLFYDYHRQEKVSNQPVVFYFDELTDRIKISSPKGLATKRDIATKIFGKLNAKEKIVILKDIEYKRLQKNHDSEILDDLEKELGVKRSTIRKIRGRAIIKINNAIDEINGER